MYLQAPNKQTNEQRRNWWCGHRFMSKVPETSLMGRKGEKKINNMLFKIHEEEKIKKEVQNRNYYRTCPACRINILMQYIYLFFI